MLDLLLFEKFNLCKEIRDVIFSYFSKYQLMWLDKKKYKLHHNCLQQILIEKRMYENYIRTITRADFYFVFDTILKTHKISSWQNKKFCYKKIKYESFVHFLDCFMFENDSHVCRDVLFSNVYKKKYKKTNRSIEWTN